MLVVAFSQTVKITPAHKLQYNLTFYSGKMINRELTSLAIYKHSLGV